MPVASAYSRKHPLLAALVRHERLTAPGSAKDTRHFVFDLAGTGLNMVGMAEKAEIKSNAPFRSPILPKNRKLTLPE